MPSNDIGPIVGEELERNNFSLIDSDSEGEEDISVLNLDIPEIITPLAITPPENNTPNTESVTSVQAATSDDDLIIPLYLFHVVERTSLNIEFNRCLQISLVHISDNLACDSISNSNYSSHTTEHNPELLNMGCYMFWNGDTHNEYADDFIIPYWLFAEAKEIVTKVPAYLFLEDSEDEDMEMDIVQFNDQYEEIENADIPDFQETEDPLI